MKKLFTDKIFGRCEWYWDIINFFLHRKWEKIEPELVIEKPQDITRINSTVVKPYQARIKCVWYGLPTFVPRNQSEIPKKEQTTSSNWIAVDKRNWGSARPDNDCVYTDENVKVVADMIMLTSEQNPGIFGVGWSGEEIAERYYTSGMVYTRNSFPAEGIFQGVISLPPESMFLGTWKAFWLFGVDSEDNYFEIDIYEQPVFEQEKAYRTTISVHFGTEDQRELYTWKVKFSKISIRNIPLACIIIDGYIRIYFYDQEVFRTKVGYPKKNQRVVALFSDAVVVKDKTIEGVQAINAGLPSKTGLNNVKIHQFTKSEKEDQKTYFKAHKAQGDRLSILERKNQSFKGFRKWLRDRL